MTVETVVRKRYSLGAKTRQADLCCPVTYDPRYLKVIPGEIIEKDYGCGDPSAYLCEGDTVLDLGSGTGKICFIASQIVGPRGKVIGVDFNQDMLRLARKYQKTVGDAIGWHNVTFRRGKIQDLRTDLDFAEKKLSKRPLRTIEDYFHFEDERAVAGVRNPMIPDESVDVIVSNCVLNLVRAEEKMKLFREMFRVLKKGGRIAISDIVSDEPVTEAMCRDPELWSGCISGAFQELQFLRAFEDAGFYGIKLDKRDEKPWRTVQGIEFRSVTVTGLKGKEGECWECNQAVIYKGPWKQVVDDDKHVLKRGVRTAVCDKTYQIYSKAPYAADVFLVPPRKAVSIEKAKSFDCHRTAERHPRETKGLKYRTTREPKSVCLDGGCC